MKCKYIVDQEALVAVDGSETSLGALDFEIDLAEKNHASVLCSMPESIN